MADDTILLGKIVGAYGVKGWVKILSYTRPIGNIQQYARWLLQQGEALVEVSVTACKPQGKGIIAKLQSVDDREQALLLRGSDIHMLRSDLPPLAAGDYYWHELMELNVVDQQQRNLGKISDILETGANDVLVVSGDKRRLIPYVMDVYVINIDLSAGQMVVDWQDAED